MKAPKLLLSLLVVLMLVLSACGATPTATPVPPTATPVPPTAVPKAALDVAKVVDNYMSNLPAGYGGIAPAVLNDQMAAAKPFLIDVREAQELTDNGFIDGAVNIPIKTLTKNLDKLPADKAAPIVTYCAVGQRGGIAMAVLQNLGYTNVKNLTGGFNAWKAANLPVKTGTPAAATAGAQPAVDKDTVAWLDAYMTGLPAGYGGVAPAALKDQMAAAKPFLIDVREASELQQNGSLEGAVNIPIKTLTKSLDKLPKDKTAPIVTYCAVGQRGVIAMWALQQLGYTNVKNMTGGFNAWTAANLPVVK